MAVLDGQTLEQAWQEVLGGWDDDQKHRRYLELCRLSGQLSEAGRRYREVREADPARAEIAAAQIDRLLNLAMQSLQRPRTPVRRRSRTWVWLGLALVAVVLVLWSHHTWQQLP